MTRIDIEKVGHYCPVLKQRWPKFNNIATIYSAVRACVLTHCIESDKLTVDSGAGAALVGGQ